MKTSRGSERLWPYSPSHLHYAGLPGHLGRPHWNPQGYGGRPQEPIPGVACEDRIQRFSASPLHPRAPISWVPWPQSIYEQAGGLRGFGQTPPSHLHCAGLPGRLGRPHWIPQSGLWGRPQEPISGLNWVRRQNWPVGAPWDPGGHRRTCAVPLQCLSRFLEGSFRRRNPFRIVETGAALGRLPMVLFN